MLGLNEQSNQKFSLTNYSIKSRKNILLIKDKDKLILRSGIIFTPKPIKISSLFPVVDLFQSPLKVTLDISLYTKSDSTYFYCIMFLDLDVTDCLREDFNVKLKHILKPRD